MTRPLSAAPRTDVVVVGGADFGEQILTEVSQLASTLWVTRDGPLILRGDVGRNAG